MGAGGLWFAPDLAPSWRQVLAYRSGLDAVLDARGRTVRCTPRRRTSMGPQADGVWLFRKLRRGRGGFRELRRLQQLAALGFRVPQPICLGWARGQSVLVLRQVEGRPMDALLREAAAGGAADRERAIRYCSDVVAPMVRRLHDHGLFYRDLYWNHLFAGGLAGAAEPAWIDVERVFRPPLRRCRWRVKDLAGLRSSLPAQFGVRAELRFLVRYGMPERALARAVGGKARAIAAHVPKYG